MNQLINYLILILAFLTGGDPDPTPRTVEVECILIAGNVDEDPNGMHDAQYDGLIWWHDFEVMGYSEWEDSEVWNNPACF